MKRKFWIILTIMESIIYIATLVLHYFTYSTMGMARHMIEQNRVWEESYPLGTIENIATGVIVVMTAATIIGYIAKSQKEKLGEITLITASVVALLFVGITLFSSAEELRSYYILVIGLGVGIIIENLKILTQINFK